MRCSPSKVRTRSIAALAGLLVIVSCSMAAAQPLPKKPRRQFVSVSVDTFSTQPLHFATWPVEDLVGREVTEAQGEPYDYRSRDGATTVDVLEFKKPGHGYGVTVYPFGLSSGATLGLRLSREDLPVIRMAFAGPAKVSSYALTDAYAVDIGAALVMADRSPGWGLGSHAFIGGGAGRVRSSLSDGKRYFAEGGGGLTVGPFGVELAVKFALNRLDAPVEHQFITVPIGLRMSVSF
jgi:hypothetical protein